MDISGNNIKQKLERFFTGVDFEEESRKIREFVSRPMFDEAVLLNKDKSYPKISIITPSYNQGQFLEKTILSVLNQNYPNLEFIIIDGGSTDNSIEIIKKYEKYIAYWISEPDKGQAHALNKGFERATGDIFGWLNSDDLYMPGVFYTSCNYFNEKQNIHIVFGDYFTIDSDNKIICKEYAFDFNVQHFIYEGFHLNAQSIFWLKEVHYRFGSFNENLHRTMDYDMILRLGLLKENKFLRIPFTIGCFRRHDAQKTQGFDDLVKNEHYLIAKENKCELKHTIFGKILRFAFRFRRAYWYLKRGGISYLFSKALFR